MKDESDEQFTEQFSNNVPEELQCVNSAIKFMQCAPTLLFSLEKWVLLWDNKVYGKSNR